MSERENGWYLRSDGYMTSECSYQRIKAMKGNRALDNGERLVFLKFMGGKETDSRVYVPHPGTCEMETDWEYLQNCIPSSPEDTWAYRCSTCGWSFRYDRGIKPKFCPECGAKVKED